MFRGNEKSKITEICRQASDRLREKHLTFFKGMDKQILLISDCYMGIWLEHVYDSLMLAKLNPDYLSVAEDTVNLFMDLQKEDGQLPFNVKDSAKFEKNAVGYAQIQECVSFHQLCYEVYEMNGDTEFLKKAYNSGIKWDMWQRNNRMTLGKGLIEMFCGFDTGHDNSGRLSGISCPGNYSVDGRTMNAATLPPDDGITPIIAVDMNAVFYATESALAKMAENLGKSEEAEKWHKSAEAVKQKLFEICYCKEDNFFYDVDRNGKKRKYLSSTIINLFEEHFFDPGEDKELLESIYEGHIKNPDEFWTEFPFPSMAISDPSWKPRTKNNCWGYFSQALIALRCTRWMDYYKKSDDMDTICEIWLKAWTECFDDIKLGQELHPVTGKPSDCSEWYSSCMLFYIYSAKRLNLI